MAEVGYYGATATHGGGLGAMDSIDGDDLNGKEVCLVLSPIKADFYKLDADSGLPENPPWVIAPDVNAGLKRWIWIFGNDQLPDGLNTGDIIRWNADSGTWESCAEPFEFDHIIFTPMDTPPTPVQGGMYFKLSENAVYVGVT